MHATRPARVDIQLQRDHDDRRRVSWPMWDARVRAVKDALDCSTLGAPGADFALRQALVDLSSACEVLASEMRAPTALIPK